MICFLETVSIWKIQLHEQLLKKKALVAAHSLSPMTAVEPVSVLRADVIKGIRKSQ